MTIKECFDTDYIEINGKRFCPYCGKQIEPQKDEKTGETIYYWKCNCEDALNSYNIKLQIEKLKDMLPSPKYYKDVVEIILPWVANQ